MDWINHINTLKAISEQISNSKEQLDQLINLAEEDARKKDIDNDSKTIDLCDTSNHLFDALYYLNNVISRLEK